MFENGEIWEDSLEQVTEEVQEIEVGKLVAALILPLAGKRFNGDGDYAGAR